MIRFIFKNWIKHKERFILLIIGVLTISVGLSYLFNITETNKGTIENTLQKHWQPSYDIVVRPKESQSLPEQNNQLLEPNFLSNIQGGISVDQYNKIKVLDHVEVAAPVAMIGYTGITINYNVDKSNFVEEPGIYRTVNTYTEDADYKTGTYFTIGEDYYINERMKGNPLDNGISSTSQQLLVGIDPQAEAELVGLDDALGDYEQNRYFQGSDRVYDKGEGIIHAPLLINPNPLDQLQFISKVEKLDIDETTIQKLQEKNEKKEIDHFLDGIEKRKEVFSFSVTGAQIKNTFFKNTFGANPFTGKQIGESKGELYPRMIMFYKTSPLDYKKTMSPYPKRWGHAYQINEKQLTSKDKSVENFVKNTYRDLNVLPLQDTYNIPFDVLGFFDPDKLEISRDPLSQLPMETYRPATADKVLDASGQPVNPPKKVPSTGNPVGLLTEPPTLLTTIDAAVALNGIEAISAIRIKVEGVEEIGLQSHGIVEQVAKDIEEQTGLMTDITIGSSPQPVLIHINKLDGEDYWIEQPWIHLGAAITVFEETMLGYTGIIVAIIAVAVIYVIATNYISYLSRRHEFGILLSMGWRTRDLRKVILSESFLLSFLAILILWIISFMWFEQGNTVSILKTLFASLVILLIYLTGASIPIIGVRNINPYETIHSGEFSTRTTRIFKSFNRLTLVLNNFYGKIKRNLFSIFVITIPTTLVTIFLFITVYLKGVLFTSWLGEYVALEVESTHYIAVGIASVIALLTTAEIMWQNVSERKAELSLLKAIGWKNSAIQSLILLEGLLVGISGAILGTILASLILFFMYGSIAVSQIYIYLISASIPIMIGFLGSILPSKFAIKINPYQGIRERK
ncbi:FtsX-like permease family protein [Ornithinibacillus salinisoli]|uniref:FtsX-like permease family protein n=1 Tax=Ornithinibacillus salinisoli TaxID=1848459 RepID=A0ABW4W1W8_9BACI